MELTKLTLAFNALGVNEKECFVIWSVLAVIYHLGNAGAVRGNSIRRKITILSLQRIWLKLEQN